ncbi:hypothetical protein BVC80_8827g12 [Macleaya cordata]|uniref:Uncharacterized protein n=1 Tax=Macleaya cordata TaxID=56857 RepID=A0A200PSC4_MACCD|nr:hypothetical protein BVC80_8827g12 [Macleaya cordata]
MDQTTCSTDDAPENRRKKISFPMRMWFSVKRTTVRLMRGRRRLVKGLMRKVYWVSLQVKRRSSEKMSRVRKGDRHVLLNYDLFSYSKNFDDGRWQLEEDEFYRVRSFANRFGQSNGEVF